MQIRVGLKTFSLSSITGLPSDDIKYKIDITAPHYCAISGHACPEFSFLFDHIRFCSFFKYGKSNGDTGVHTHVHMIHRLSKSTTFR